MLKYYTISSNKILAYLIGFILNILIFLGSVASLYEFITGHRQDDFFQYVKLFLLCLASLFTYPVFVLNRIKNAYQIVIKLNQQELILKKFRWQRLSWQPEYHFSYAEIKAIAFSGSFTTEGMAWVLLNNGEKIWLKSGTDNSRIKLSAQEIAKKANLPFTTIPVEKTK